MTRLRIAFAVGAFLTAVPQAPALDLGFGLLKRKQNPQPPGSGKTDPAMRVKQLVATLQSDPDVDRRKAAAEELKAADPRANTDILPTLVGSMQKDPSTAVRTAAAEAIGAMKAVSPAAGAALEGVEKNDPDAGVRAAAKAALWQYQLNGYKVAASAAPGTGQTGEPPFAVRPSKSPAAMAVTPTEPAFRPITQGPGKASAFKETAEPPFAKPKQVPAAKPVEAPLPSIMPPPLPTPTTQPGDLPPLTIPSAPPTIVAPPPGNGGLPTIAPPSGR